MNTARFFIFALALAASPLAVSAQGEQRFCTMQYEPVCGAKQVQCITTPCYPQYQTYGNSCMMANDGATLIHKGECLPSETGPVKTEPAPSKPPAKPYTPPASCTSWFDGCNNCTLMENGSAACTKRYCANPAAGYCTAYEPAKPSTSDGTDTPELATTSSVEEQNYFKPFSFLKRAWLHILDWFSDKFTEPLVTELKGE